MPTLLLPKMPRSGRGDVAGAHSLHRLDMPPCSACGNTFIECFGKRKSWWVGCKPCGNHVHAKSRWQARRKWKRRHISILEQHGDAESRRMIQNSRDAIATLEGVRSSRKSS